MDALEKPPKCHKLAKIHFKMINHFLIIMHICERLFDELVKEWLKERYTIVSGTIRIANGRKVRIKKAHLRRKRR